MAVLRRQLEIVDVIIIIIIIKVCFRNYIRLRSAI